MMCNATAGVFLCGILLVGGTVYGTPPSVEALGRALGYPSDQLVVTDVTAKEQAILSSYFPWKLEPARPDLPPEKILEAYRITAKDERTFLPIVITIAEEGTYFSPRSLELINLCDAHKDDPPSGGGGMGWHSIPGVGEAGIFISGIRAPSRTSGIKSAIIATALLSEIRVPELKREIRIAIMAALDVQGQDQLVAIPGGEMYFATFGRDEEGRKMVGYKTSDLFAQLGRAVSDSVLDNPSPPRGAATPISNSADNAPSMKGTNQPPGLTATRVTPDRNSKPSEDKETRRGQEGIDAIARVPVWAWWTTGLVVVVGALLAIHRSRR